MITIAIIIPRLRKRYEEKKLKKSEENIPKGIQEHFGEGTSQVNKEGRSSKDIRGCLDIRKSKDTRGSQDIRFPKDPRGTKENRGFISRSSNDILRNLQIIRGSNKDEDKIKKSSKS